MLAHHAAPNDYGFAAAAAGKGGPAGLALPEDRGRTAATRPEGERAGPWDGAWQRCAGDDAFVRRGSDVLVQDSSGVFIMYVQRCLQGCEGHQRATQSSMLFC